MPTGTTIKRQPQLDFSDRSMGAGFLPNKGDLADRAAFYSRGNQQKTIRVCQAFLKPVVMIFRRNWLRRKAIGAYLKIVDPV